MPDALPDAPGDGPSAFGRSTTRPAQARPAGEAPPQGGDVLTAQGSALAWRLALLGALYVLAFLAVDLSLSGWLLKRALGPEHGRGLVLWSSALGACAFLALAALRGPVERRTRLYAAAAFLASGAIALLRW